MMHTAHTDLHSMREKGVGASLNNAKTLPDLKQSFLLVSVHVSSFTDKCFAMLWILYRWYFKAPPSFCCLCQVFVYIENISISVCVSNRREVLTVEGCFTAPWAPREAFGLHWKQVFEAKQRTRFFCDALGCSSNTLRNLLTYICVFNR